MPPNHVEVVDQAIGRLAVVLSILKKHQDRYFAPVGCDARDKNADDHPDGYDLTIAIEQVTDVRNALKNGGGERCSR